VSISIAHTYIDELDGVAKKDVDGIKVKDAAYGGSWKKRGGIGAYMMMCRKWDRLEKAVEHDHGFDIFKAIEQDTRDESVLDDIRDLRRYLLLIEAEIQARRTMADRARAVDNYRPSIEITGSGQPWGEEIAKPIANGPSIDIVAKPWLPSRRWAQPLDSVLPPISILHNPPSTVSRTETVTCSPQTTTIAPPSNTWDREAEMPRTIDCPCGYGSRQDHPSTWCTRPSLGDF
jgi:hypothetical protein